WYRGRPPNGRRRRQRARRRRGPRLPQLRLSRGLGPAPFRAEHRPARAVRPRPRRTAKNTKRSAFVRRRLAAIASLACVLAGCGDDQATGRTQGGSDYPDPRVISVFDEIHISSVADAEYFQHAVRAIDFGSDPLERATLSVSLQSPCFPFDNWTPDAIPEGHGYPRLCDAFDRTFLFSLDDPSDPAEGPPGVELVRAITPFGGPLSFETDITDIANGLHGSHDLNVDIQTWGDSAGMVSGAEG